MKIVHKYLLQQTDHQWLELPRYSEVLTVQEQGNELYLWAKVDTQNPITKKSIVIVGTGHDASHTGTYLGTCQLHSGQIVLHVFEGRSK